LFTIHPDEGIEQTKNILAMIAAQRAGTLQELDTKTIDTWKQYHSLLKPVEVVIPFAGKIGEFINKNKIVPMSTRRAFKRVLIVIQSVTCAYQYQRKTNDHRKLIAEMCDYWMALQIVTESFRENMGAPDGKTEERLEFIKEKGMVFSKDIAKEYGISASAVTSWTSKKVKDGILTWCDEQGHSFIDEKDLGKAKRSGKAYLKVQDEYDPSKVTGLPSPFDLTGETDWDTNGKFYRMYDLELGKKTLGKQVFDGVLDVFRPPLNTSQGDEEVNPIPESDDEVTGVKVFIGNRGEEKNNIDEGEDVPENIDEDLESEFLGITTGENGNGKNATITPFICRKGCKHYDGVKDVNDGEFKEFCDMTGGRIGGGAPCVMIEPKGIKLPEGVLAF
jgi:hypothetical protein